MPKSGHAITARSRPESVNGRGSGVQGGKWPFAGRRAPSRRATVAPSAGNGADQRAIRRRCARDKRQKREKAAGWAILQQTNASGVFTLYKPQPPRYYSPRSNDSSVVQSVERRTVNPYVTGSSPVRGAKFREARSGKPERAFCLSINWLPLPQIHPRSLKTTRSYTLLLVKLVLFAFYQHAERTVI